MAKQNIYDEHPLGFPIIEIQTPPLPKKTVRESVFIARKNLPAIVWNSLRTMENNPTSLPQTQTILQGRTVSGLSIGDMMQIKRFGDGFSAMLDLVQNENFHLNVDTACKIHAIVGREEALEWGVIRSQQVHLGNLEYMPPAPSALEKIIDAGIEELSKIENSYAKSLNTFMFMSKAQLFFDCNKRTALIMMNGLLLSSGICPVYTPATMMESFSEALTAVYENANPEPMSKFFVAVCEMIYPSGVDYGPRISAHSTGETSEESHLSLIP